MKFFKLFGNKKKNDLLKDELWDKKLITNQGKKKQLANRESNFVLYSSKGRPKCMTCTFRIEQTEVKGPPTPIGNPGYKQAQEVNNTRRATYSHQTSQKEKENVHKTFSTPEKQQLENNHAQKDRKSSTSSAHCDRKEKNFRFSGNKKDTCTTCTFTIEPTVPKSKEVRENSINWLPVKSMEDLINCDEDGGYINRRQESVDEQNENVNDSNSNMLKMANLSKSLPILDVD